MINKTIVILAGGFGTRLQSVLNGLPKPLANINGEPFLKYQFENWIRNGFNDFIISLHYRSDLIIDFINQNKNGLLKNCKIQYIVEPHPLGTGGAISFLISKCQMTDLFYVANADTWIENGYNALDIEYENVIGLTKVNSTSRYGSVSTDKENLIIKFEEKNKKRTSAYINIGLYKLHKSVFYTHNQVIFSLENDLFPKLVNEKKLKAVYINSRFIDIGIPEDYIKFCNSKK
jgi:D-glycero-alpha-D-manno-heptose 1-phosphate guanylyltransferase